MSSREGEQDWGRGSASSSARSLLPNPVSTRPPRIQATEPQTSHTLLQCHRALTTILPTASTYHRTKAPGTLHTEYNQPNVGYLENSKTAIQQTSQPTPALTFSSNTHIELVALVVEAYIASLAKTESYGSVLSKSLKRNFDIDTSFHVRNSQRILNLRTNPTTHPEPAL
ncbi:hypothetical protein FHG87_012575 [Trinorchestia longiramus]|nr:hypothetical protein FHG87_012575 [Trinorchestia longiramus]